MQLKRKTIILLLSALLCALLLMVLFAHLIVPYPTPPPLVEITPAPPLNLAVRQSATLEINGSGLPNDLRASLSRDDDNRSSILQWFDLPGDAKRFVIADGIGYLAAGYNGMQVIDINDPRNLRIIGSVPSDGMAYDLIVRGKTVFLSAHGLQVIDISQPRAPRTLATLSIPDIVLLDLAIKGDTLYAGSNKGLQIFDIRQPASPKHLDTLPFTGGPWALAVKGDLLLASVRQRHQQLLQVFDISTPYHPRRLAQIELPRQTWSIGIHEGYAYLPIEADGIAIIDIRQPSAPKLQTVFNDNLYARFITIHGNRVYCTSLRGDFTMYDLDTPTALRRIGDVSLPPLSHPATLGGHTAFVANGNAGLLSIDVAKPRRYPHALTLNKPKRVHSIQSDGDLIYMASDSLYIARRNLTNNSLEPLSVLPSPKLALRKQARIGNILCALSIIPHQALFVDISDPLHPQLIGSLGSTSGYVDITASANCFFLAEHNEKILAVAPTNLHDPKPVATIDVPGVSRLLAADGYLLAAASGGALLTVIDITDPKALHILKRLTLPWPLSDSLLVQDMLLANQQLVLSTGEAGLLFIDVSRPKNPALQGGINIGETTEAIAFKNDRLYVATKASRLWVLQREGASYIPVATTGTMGNKTESIQIAGDEALLANGGKGLAIIQLPQELNVEVVIPQQTLQVQIPAGLEPGDYQLRLIANRKPYLFTTIHVTRPEDTVVRQNL